MIRLLFLISVLNRGGAERQLTLLAKSIDQRRFIVTVVTVYADGPLWADIEGIDGIELVSLHKKSRGDYLRPLWRLARIMRQQQPHIVHGYLGVANILSLLFGKPNGAKIVWGLRASDIDFALYDRLSAWHFRLAAWLSRHADLIIANSNAGKRHHALNGFADSRMIVIPNGFDTAQFAPDPARGQQLREEWGVAEHEQLIGLGARLDPIKDHATFLRAAALLAQDRERARFGCIGDGPASYARGLRELADELGLGHRLAAVDSRNLPRGILPCPSPRSTSAMTASSSVLPR
jgi:glycosyltransferase involved in cell wall biosynthesis